MLAWVCIPVCGMTYTCVVSVCKCAHIGLCVCIVSRYNHVPVHCIMCACLDVFVCVNMSVCFRYWTAIMGTKMAHTVCVMKVGRQVGFMAAMCSHSTGVTWRRLILQP